MPRDQPATAFLGPAFLGVEASITGRRWVGPGVEVTRRAEAMAQGTGLPDPVCGVLAARGVEGCDAPAYLAPKLRDLMPDPRRLRDVGRAAERLVRAAREGERIAVFADYDVDGATSAALLIDWLSAQGREATLYVPDRIAEGYGPNAPAIARLCAAHDLVVCVDCGTMAHEALAAATCDVVVLDHHLGAETLPQVHAIVNPNRQDEDGALGHLCAAAVTFLTLVEAGRRMREAGAEPPDLTAGLDLVALATVADVAPLVGVNRAFVRAGLQVMRARRRPGLVALAEAARLDGPASSHHLGFVLGPRINAGGRIGRADLGARLLICRDPAEAGALAARLEEVNAERRAVEAGVREAALAQAEAREPGPVAWAAGRGWHPGVVGIVAGRLARVAGCPAVVLGIEDGLARGSARSVPGIDLGRAVQRLVREGLLETGGGHAMAAGLSAREDRLPEAMARLGALLARQGAGGGGPRELALDGVLMPGAATVELCEALEAAGPYGEGAPAPRFACPGVAVHHVRRMGERHLKVQFSDGLGPRREAVAFGAHDGPLGPAIENHGGARLHLAGRIEVNHWRGRRTVQLRLSDAARA